MPRPYSPDLRLRVLRACAAGEGKRAELARRFQIGASTLYRWLEQERTEGRREAKPHAGGFPSRFDAEPLRALIGERNDRTLAECVALYEERTGTRVSLSSVERLLQRLGLRRKKKDAPRQRTGARRHEATAVRVLIEAAGCRLLYLPPYSPEFNPIEQCWSKLKTLLRGAAARTRETLEHALATVLDAITAADARGWFAHCGYIAAPN